MSPQWVRHRPLGLQRACSLRMEAALPLLRAVAILRSKQGSSSARASRWQPATRARVSQVEALVSAEVLVPSSRTPRLARWQQVEVATTARLASPTWVTIRGRVLWLTIALEPTQARSLATTVPCTMEPSSRLVARQTPQQTMLWAAVGEPTSTITMVVEAGLCHRT